MITFFDYKICTVFSFLIQKIITRILLFSEKVLVHCSQGISRSSTFAIAYLMIKKHMTIQEAVRQIRTHRKICPNSGFIFQLVKLNTQLQSCS